MKRCSLVLVIKGKGSGWRKVPVLHSVVLGLWPAPRRAGPRLQCRNECLAHCKQCHVFCFFFLQSHAVMSSMVMKLQAHYWQCGSNCKEYELIHAAWQSSQPSVACAPALPFQRRSIWKKIKGALVEDNKKKNIYNIVKEQIQSYPPPPPEISIQRVMMRLKSNTCTHFAWAGWQNHN